MAGIKGKNASKSAKTATSRKRAEFHGDGGELHQLAKSRDQNLTTNQGIPVSDNQNSLRVGSRGPTLLEDFAFREKITHFDHERIPERIVHARGSGAHGYFEVYKSQAEVSCADFLQRPGERTRVFARFSTVAGGAGSGDLARDVRGFAVKFYTNEGNFDLVGNNLPVFFIQDAVKFPDLIHAAKMDPDRGYPQAATANDTFWDFVSLMPESMHMIMWAMSDRTIPRSLRMMEGFGIHTFRLVAADGNSTFVKFHWRPKLGMQSVLWDEAVKINGADPDFHRRDLWEAIDRGDFPEWELSLQLFTESEAAGFDFDVLDATKLIPEEIVPLTPVGRMVLDRNPDNFFAETEQVAFCPANIVPGIDFSDDPLLQGRLFSYLDTQLSRLGGPNFHEIPINRPVCPFQNFQRDAQMRMTVPKGRVNYEPNSLAPEGPRETVDRGFKSFPRRIEGTVQRVRAASFADHYSQARLFFRSQTDPERGHIVAALTFELSKVATPAIRDAVLSHLVHVDAELAAAVATGLGSDKPIEPAETQVEARDMSPSPALSIIAKAPHVFDGRVVGCLVTDGVDGSLVDELRDAVSRAGGIVKIIAPKISGVRPIRGAMIEADFQLGGAPSVFFDAVVILASPEGGKTLAADSAAVDFLRDAFAHLKIIGQSAGAAAVFEAAGLAGGKGDAGIVKIAKPADIQSFLELAKRGRLWEREARIRPVR